MQNFVRGILLACVVFLCFGCSGPTKPKPSALAPAAGDLRVAKLWQANIGPIGFALDAKVVGGSVYLASDSGKIVQINAISGLVEWSHDVGQALSAGVGSDGEYAAVVTQSGDLALVSRSGLRWRQKLGAASITPPLVAGGRVFAITPNGVLSAFDLSTGRKLWQQQRTSASLVLDHAGLLLPVGNTLVVGVGGRMLGVNPLNGSQRWDVPIAVSRGANEVERLVDVLAGVSRNGSNLCVRAYRTAISCVDTEKPSVVWSKSAKGHTGVAGDGQLVFAAESDGQVMALRRLDGEPVWRNYGFLWRDLASPIAVADYVVVPDHAGFLHFLSKASGRLVGRVAIDGAPVVSAVGISENIVIAVTQKGAVYAYRPE